MEIIRSSNPCIRRASYTNFSSRSNFIADEAGNRSLTLRYTCARPSSLLKRSNEVAATRKPIVSSAKGNESEEDETSRAEEKTAATGVAAS